MVISSWQWWMGWFGSHTTRWLDKNQLATFSGRILQTLQPHSWSSKIWRFYQSGILPTRMHQRIVSSYRLVGESMMESSTDLLRSHLPGRHFFTSKRRSTSNARGGDWDWGSCKIGWRYPKFQGRQFGKLIDRSLSKFWVSSRFGKNRYPYILDVTKSKISLNDAKWFYWFLSNVAGFCPDDTASNEYEIRNHGDF